MDVDVSAGKCSHTHTCFLTEVFSLVEVIESSSSDIVLRHSSYVPE